MWELHSQWQLNNTKNSLVMWSSPAEILQCLICLFYSSLNKTYCLQPPQPCQASQTKTTKDSSAMAVTLIQRCTTHQSRPGSNHPCQMMHPTSLIKYWSAYRTLLWKLTETATLRELCSKNTRLEVETKRLKAENRQLDETVSILEARQHRMGQLLEKLQVSVTNCQTRQMKLNLVIQGIAESSKEDTLTIVTNTLIQRLKFQWKELENQEPQKGTSV